MKRVLIILVAAGFVIVVAFVPTRRVSQQPEPEPEPTVASADPDLDQIEQRLDAMIVGGRTLPNPALPETE